MPQLYFIRCNHASSQVSNNTKEQSEERKKKKHKKQNHTVPLHFSGDKAAFHGESARAAAHGGPCLQLAVSCCPTSVRQDINVFGRFGPSYWTQTIKMIFRLCG